MGGDADGRALGPLPAHGCTCEPSAALGWRLGAQPVFYTLYSVKAVELCRVPCDSVSTRRTDIRIRWIILHFTALFHIQSCVVTFDFYRDSRLTLRCQVSGFTTHESVYTQQLQIALGREAQAPTRECGHERSVAFHTPARGFGLAA